MMNNSHGTLPVLNVEIIAGLLSRKIPAEVF
jgi:hypothetical protein